MGEIKVERADNGFVLSYIDPDYRHTMVFQADAGDEYGRIESAREMFYELMEMLGLVGTRYDAKRLYIGIKPGDKYEETARETEE